MIHFADKIKSSTFHSKLARELKVLTSLCLTHTQMSDVRQALWPIFTLLFCFVFYVVVPVSVIRNTKKKEEKNQKKKNEETFLMVVNVASKKKKNQLI